MLRKNLTRAVFAVLVFALQSKSGLFAQVITGTGTGTASDGYIARFSALHKITNTGSIYQQGSNFGIGTLTPTNKLQLVVSGPNDGIRITQTGLTASSVGLFNSGAGAHNWGLFSTGSGNSQGAGHFLIFDYTSGLTRLFINGTTGSVGIGTETPFSAAGLNVHNGALMLSGAVAGYGGPQLLFSNNQTVAQWAEEYTTASGSNGLNFWKPYGSSGSPGNYYLFLGDNGHVGVNTNNPTAQFTVNGKTLIGDPTAINISTIGNYNLYVQNGILTEKVRVAVSTSTNWADYVFDPGYKLKPLSEVERFVKENKHLPGVPAICEVEEDGIDVAQMDATLLKKVEELTLYVIEQNKKLDLQQHQIDALLKQQQANH